MLRRIISWVLPKLIARTLSMLSKSLKAAISVLDKRVVNLKKMEVSENVKKELAEVDTLCYDIKERMNDHKDMQKGVYKQDKDFVSVFKSKFLLISLICSTYT